TEVIVSEGDGLWREYIGGYSDWERVRPSQAAVIKAAKAELKVEPKQEVAAVVPKKKLSYKEQRELEELPKLIASLEAEQKTISARLADPDLYKQPAAEVKLLNARFAEIDVLLLDALEQWEVIEARAKG
ncbi:MAG: ABC transporter ATP-binding protein, partial [bacterium]